MPPRPRWQMLCKSITVKSGETKSHVIEFNWKLHWRFTYKVLRVWVRFVVVFYSRPELQEAYRLAMISIQLSSCFLHSIKKNKRGYIDIVLVYFYIQYTNFLSLIHGLIRLLRIHGFFRIFRGRSTGDDAAQQRANELVLQVSRFVEVFWNNSFLPHDFCAPNFSTTRFFHHFFCSKLEAVEKGGRHLNRKDFHHRHFRHSLLWKSSDTFLPRTWGSKTIPRRSLAASSRGKI